MDPSAHTERDHSGDVVFAENFAITRTLAVAKVKSIDDLSDWQVRHADYGDGAATEI